MESNPNYEVTRSGYSISWVIKVTVDCFGGYSWVSTWHHLVGNLLVLIRLSTFGVRWERLPAGRLRMTTVYWLSRRSEMVPNLATVSGSTNVDQRNLAI